MSLQAVKQTNRQTGNLTGFPSIDKPWTRFYTQTEKEAAIPEGSMFDYLYEQNKAYPSETAIEYYGRKITYQELFRNIDQCCRNLAALGIKKGDIVTIQSLPLPQVIILIYALTRMGACGNMLYPDAKAKDVVSSMKKTSSDLLIVIDKMLSGYETELPDSFRSTIILLNVADQMPFLPGMIVRKAAAYHQQNHKLHTITWKAFIGGKGEDYEENHDADLPAFMLRTGGTTGIPKEVVLSSRCFNAVSAGVYHAQMCSKWQRRKNSLLLMPPFIAFGISSGIHNSLTFGTKLIIVLDVTPSAISKYFLKYKPNYITVGTVHVEQLLEDLGKSSHDLSCIEMLAVGGEAMSAAFEEKLQQFLHNNHCPITPIKGYGLTETCGCVIAETMQAHRTGSVGIPISLANMKVIDPDTGRELSYNQSGEICLSSAGIMQGYYQNRQATDDIITVENGERWLHTGDIGMISEDGLLTISGRIKRIITCREGVLYHKVFPLLLEDQIAKLPGVQEICIVGKPDETVGNTLVAYVVPEEPAQFEQVKNRISSYCSAELETYERPAEYRCLDQMPRTLIGKVDYRALEQMALKDMP